MTAENDIVLIHFEGKPVVFARIEAIHPDVKPDWYQIKLLMLQVPLQPVTWILRTAYINGTEFTMGGNRIRLEEVVCPPDETIGAEENNQTDDPESIRSANVISLTDLKKK
ncbi:hypothetical protein D3OALGA1CA_2321 [Olavius algarvensis associated proteobacterium Delta 3]|nr:hypothetical protein D3OALGB2SA_223 [Olavius algarvensis associated proteobacterium Delta 3]CAB5116893.1 hypothetical protein D3OALGA1CA_2321 [Olavius algarvensis associated proteobacterium Delta 3]